MLVLGLPGHPEFTAQLAQQLDCPYREVELHRFPDGEALVRIDAPVQGQCVVLAASLDQADGRTLPLVFAADAARELGAVKVGLAAPYLGYMRQDTRFHPGEAVTSRSYARILSSTFDFLATVEPHLHRWRSLSEIYAIPARAVAAAPAIAQWVRQHIARPLLVGPDSESERWVAETARAAGAPHVVMEKRRFGDADVQVTLRGQAAWHGHTPVLVDDVASTGATLAEAARALVAAGLPPPVCVVVHALFGSGSLERMREAGIPDIASCDTIAHPTNAIHVAPLLAQAVRELLAGGV